MILRDYIKELIQIVEDNPQYEELEVYYSIDDEGNDYRPVGEGMAGMVGHYSKEDYEFLTEEDITEIEKEGDVCIELNAIVIN